MSISVDRFLASRDWGVYQDTETGHPSYVNRKTGELCDAVSIAVPPGSVILTPEEQERRHDYWLTQQDAAMRATQKQQASLRRKEGPKYFFVSCEESLWEHLEPATAARLILLTSYLDYNGRLMLSERTQMRRWNLPEVLGLSPSLITSFWKTVRDKYLVEDTNGCLYMKSNHFCRGELKHGGQFQFFYIDAVRALYRCAAPRQHKHLGYVFRMLPYVNREFNVLCHDPWEENPEKLRYLSVADFCKKVGYQAANRRRLAAECARLLLQTEAGAEPLCSFMMQGKGIDTARIYLNPRVFYRGSHHSLVWNLGNFHENISFYELPNFSC